MVPASLSLLAELCEIKGNIYQHKPCQEQDPVRAMINPEGHYRTRGMVTGNPAVESWGLHTRLRHTELQDSLEAEPVPSSWLSSQPSTFKVIVSISILCAHLGEVLLLRSILIVIFLTLSGASVY